MEELYLGWVEQLERGLEKWGKVRVEGRPRLVVVTGMGGSGCVGDYVQALAWEKNNSLPVIVSKDYRLPGYVSSNDLVFVISYSGKTLETISAYKQAVEKRTRIVIITSDGYLAEEAEAKDIPVVKVIEGIPPRTALPEMLYGVLGVLDTSGATIISKDEAESALEFLKENIKYAVDEAYRIPIEIDRSKRNLVIATHTPLGVLAIRGKNEFNENAKIPVKIDVAPEWAHNDIVGWEEPYKKDWFSLLLVDPENRVGRKLVDFMETIYREVGVETYKVVLKGKSLLEKLLFGSLVLGLASVKLARLRGIDPMETRNIKRYKSVVKEILDFS